MTNESGNNSANAIWSFTFIEALRAGDKKEISTLLAQPEAKTEGRSSSPLHLAVQIASLDLIKLVANHSSVDLNAPDAHGNTALHIAAKAGRTDTVKYLVEVAKANLTLINDENMMAEEVARTPEISEYIKMIHDEMIVEHTRNFVKYSLAGDLAELEKMFSEPRIASVVDVNYQDPQTGQTVLHGLAASGNVALVKWVLGHGVDVFLRDKKNRLAQDMTKNTIIKTLIKDAAGTAPVTTTTGTAAPRLEGVLHKWTNYAGGYKPRWFVLEMGILSYFRNKEEAGSACRGSINVTTAKLWIDANDKVRFDLLGRGSIRYHLKANHQVEAQRWILAINQSKQWMNEHSTISFTASLPLLSATRERGDYVSVYNMSVRRASHQANSRYSLSPTRGGGVSHLESPPMPQSEPAKSDASNHRHHGEDSADSSIQEEEEDPRKDQLALTYSSAKAQLDIQSKLLVSIRDELNHASVGKGNWEQLVKLADSFERSVNGLKAILESAESLSDEHESWWSRKVEDERERQRIWEESFKRMALKQQQMQEALEETLETPAAIAPVKDEDEEDDDVFFDAEEAEGPLTVAVSEKEEHYPPDYCIRISYQGYPERLRTTLPLKEQELPSISIWSVLKSSIGKDLTKISLPVFFNEPTSMLQRMCEDIEYSPLLDVASRRRHSIERILYVAAFAMSNYSSTEGRVAKPFNPLLGETFEYVRPDRSLRYLSEQVSHHPPISACYCESPNYNFFSEVNLKSKFWGSSFELEPTGLSHVQLKIPRERANNWKSDPEKYKLEQKGLEGRVLEHYSWTKVTTAIQNIIIGKIYIEHYGDMIVRNHRTGDVCQLTFKQRGWGGRGAFEIEGVARDASGKEFWELHGHWNDRLVAKPKVGGGSVEVKVTSPNASDEDFSSSNVVDLKGGHKGLLLWKKARSESPRTFNLTEFATTLNDLPEDLRVLLPPTDSRLRPDQQAMEKGDWDLAVSEKTRLEENQRARRRQQEAESKDWKPRWFKRTVEPDTREQYWQFDTSYWESRGKSEWNDVVNIFS